MHINYIDGYRGRLWLIIMRNIRVRHKDSVHMHHLVVLSQVPKCTKQYQLGFAPWLG